MALTVKKILRLKQRGKYADRDGLYLQVKSATNRSWLYRYTLRGKPHWMGLGAEKDVNLFAARTKAFRARQQARQGVDPIAAKNQTRQENLLASVKTETFEACATAYFEAHAIGWSQKTRKGYQQNMLAYVYPKLGKLNIAAIDTALVRQCVEPIWQTKTATASNVRRRIENIWDWAKTHGYCSGENPARWDGHLEHSLASVNKIKKTQHHAALPYAEVAAFMAALRAKEGIPARALEFTTLVACRTNEVIGAQWDEIDLENKVWTVPKERMKIKDRDHRVPLCPRLIDLLQELPGLNEYIFPVSAKAMTRLLKDMGYASVKATVHGFRSTFRDWAAETTHYPNEVVEMALAHAIGSKVEAAYRRGDLFIKRTRLMEDWANYCATPHIPAAVVPMRRAG